MTVSNILDDIENLVVDGRHIVFTNKSIIEEPELIRLVDDLRNELPLELQRAEQVMQEKDTILSDARDEAQRIVEQAKEYANRLVDESNVVKQSQEKAALILTQAQAQEKEIMERTMETAQQRCDQANQYANQVFDHMLAHLGNSMTTLEQGLDTLQQAKAALNQAPVEPAVLQSAEAPLGEAPTEN